MGQNRITFYDDLLVIEGLIQLEDHTKIIPSLDRPYYTKIKVSPGEKVLIYKEPIYCYKTERVPGNDGYVFKYFFKK